MATYDDEIDETVRSVWGAMFALPLSRIDPAATRPDPMITGIVVLDGDFEGAVEVGCSSDLAGRIAAVMFADDATPTEDDISDALGEVSNMIAGNLKTSLPGHNSIGLPIVAFGTDYTLAIPGAARVGLASYVSDGEPLQVSLMRQGGSQ